MSKRFNEDSRVKIPTLLHLTRLGYNYLSIHGKEKPTWDEENNIFTAIEDSLPYQPSRISKTCSKTIDVKLLISSDRRH